MNKLYLRQGHFLQGFAVIILCEAVKKQSQITYGYVSEEEDGGMSGTHSSLHAFIQSPFSLRPYKEPSPTPPSGQRAGRQAVSETIKSL